MKNGFCRTTPVQTESDVQPHGTENDKREIISTMKFRSDEEKH